MPFIGHKFCYEKSIPIYQKKEAKFNASTLDCIIIDYINIIYNNIDFSKEVKYMRLLLIRN